jgi:TolA-binding protein
LAGDPTRALQAYQAARSKHSSPDRSAFAIGLVEFDQRGRYASAAEWFARYIQEQPRGPLVDEARGRLMEAWQRSGNAAKAREVAEAYLTRSPRGQYADLARRLTRPE